MTRLVSGYMQIGADWPNLLPSRVKTDIIPAPLFFEATLATFSFQLTVLEAKISAVRMNAQLPIKLSVGKVLRREHSAKDASIHVRSFLLRL